MTVYQPVAHVRLETTLPLNEALNDIYAGVHDGIWNRCSYE